MAFLESYQRAQKEFKAFYDEIPTNSRKIVFGSYDISYKTNGNLQQVKYGQICKFDHLWQHACRGTTIVSIPGEKSEIVYSLNKFFNLGELKSKMNQDPLLMMQQMEADGFEIILAYKEDGTNIKTFFDSTGQVYSMTLGSVDSAVKMQSAVADSPTFTGLSLDLLRRDFPHLLEYLRQNPYVALVSELESPWNVIVTKYPETRIVPLCLIGRDGLPQWSTLHELIPDHFTPQGLPVGSFKTTAATFDADMSTYFDQLVQDPKRYGHNPEGFVAYAYRDGVCLPWAKGKRDEYLTAHRSISLNVGSDRSLMHTQFQVLRGEFDDEMGVGAEVLTRHALQFTEELHSMVDQFKSIVSQLQSGMTPKDIADVVTSLPKRLVWLKTPLFQLRGNFEALEHPSQFLVDTLLLHLDKIHQQSGALWFFSSSQPEKITKPVVEPFLVISDFDGTLVHYNGDPSMIPDNLTFYESTTNLIRGYYDMGARLAIVTGRSESLAPTIAQRVEDHFGFPIPVHGCPDNVKIATHKAITLDRLRQSAETIVHLEDDSTILRSNYDRLTKIRYLGIQVIDGQLAEITSSQKSRVIVTLVQPPGSGKTTILRRLEEHYSKDGRRVSYVSPDQTYRKCREEMNLPKGEKVPGDVIYRALVRAFAHACNVADLIIIDMCHDKSDMLKSIANSGCIPVVRTFMNLVSVRTKSGKLRQDLDPVQLELYRSHAHERLKGETETTLIDKIDDVLEKKVAGCVQQVQNRQIPSLSSGTIEDMTAALIAEIDPVLSTPTSSQHPQAYIAIPVDVPEIPERLGFNPVRYPHLTIAAPSTHLDLTTLGRKYEFEMGELHHGEHTSFHPASIGHVTRLVETGHSAKIANQECVGVEMIPISHHVGYTVLM